jgi:hypothetical protein
MTAPARSEPKLARMSRHSRVIRVESMGCDKRGKRRSVRRPAAAVASTSPPTTLIRTATASHDRHRRRSSARNTRPTAPNQSSSPQSFDPIVSSPRLGRQGGQPVYFHRASTPSTGGCPVEVPLSDARKQNVAPNANRLDGPAGPCRRLRGLKNWRKRFAPVIVPGVVLKYES